MRRYVAVCAVAAMLLSPVIWAQKFPEYTATGTVNLNLEGKQTTYHTTANTVPNQAGRLVHTARWKKFEPRMMGGVDLSPPGIFVSISSRPAIEPDSRLPELRVTFSLDENSYTLLENAPVEVVYIVKEGPLAGEYRQASGSLKIQSATRQEADLIKIDGRANGTLAPRKRGKQGGGSVLNFEADFTVQAYQY